MTTVSRGGIKVITRVVMVLLVILLMVTINMVR